MVSVLVCDLNLGARQFLCCCYIHFRDYHFCFTVVFHSRIPFYGPIFSYCKRMQYLI